MVAAVSTDLYPDHVPSPLAGSTAASSTFCRTPPLVAPSAPKLSKEELRAQGEKLERANANLRTNDREASREAKTTAARIDELEEQVAQLEKQSAARAVRVNDNRASLAPKSRRARHREIDPGDSVPPGVAVECCRRHPWGSLWY
jgi:septal ring factor EnvC (AmiA/AmiB activator)